MGIAFIPMSSYVFPFQNKLAIWLFGDVVNLIIDNHLDFTSDTLGLNILLIILFLIAILITALVRITPYFVERKSKIENLIRVIIFYYIASRMMVYGFDKIFKTQFYLPEPNIMYTHFGKLSKDILFWSVMGTSKWYCILSGIAEVIPAIFLLFKRTRIIGLCWLLLVLIHVLTINIGFDISVKLYSLFLLFLTLLLLSKHWQAIYSFFIKREQARLIEPTTLFEKSKNTLKGFKFFVVGMIFIEALKFPISTGYLSDDDVPRPPMHGAYEVTKMEASYYISVIDGFIIERFFIHKDDYFIFQYENGNMASFKMDLDQTSRKIYLETDNEFLNEINYELYNNKNNLDLLFVLDSNNWNKYYCRKLEYQELPALKDEFHWTIDEFKID